MVKRADLVPLRHFIIDRETEHGIMLGCAACSTGVTAGSLDFALQMMADHWTKMIAAHEPAHTEIQ